MLSSKLARTLLKMTFRDSSRPHYSRFSAPKLFQYYCESGEHDFTSTLADEGMALSYHERICRFQLSPGDGIADIETFRSYHQYDVDYLMLDEDVDGELESDPGNFSHVEFQRIGLDPGLNYGMTEINEAVQGTIDGFTFTEPVTRIDETIVLPPSTLFLELQAMAAEKYCIDTDSATRNFSLRYGVKWQDLLSLAKFSVENHLTQAGGESMIKLIHEIMHRNGCQKISLHKSWESVERSIGRRILPKEMVRLLVTKYLLCFHFLYSQITSMVANGICLV